MLIYACSCADRQLFLCRYFQPTYQAQWRYTWYPVIISSTVKQPSFTVCSMLLWRSMLSWRGVWSVLINWEWKYRQINFILKAFGHCNKNLLRQEFPALRYICTLSNMSHILEPLLTKLLPNPSILKVASHLSLSPPPSVSLSLSSFCSVH